MISQQLSQNTYAPQLEMRQKGADVKVPVSVLSSQRSGPWFRNCCQGKHITGSSQMCSKNKEFSFRKTDSPCLFPWDLLKSSTSTMVKGRKAQTALPDCGFLSYRLYIVQYLRYKQFVSCRVVRRLQEGSMQYMRSTAWKKQWMDPERKSTLSLKIGCPCPFCPCPAE